SSARALSGPLIITRRSKPAQKRSGRPASTIALASPSARVSASSSASIISADSALALPSSISTTAVFLSPSRRYLTTFLSLPPRREVPPPDRALGHRAERARVDRVGPVVAEDEHRSGRHDVVHLRIARARRRGPHEVARRRRADRQGHRRRREVVRIG